MKRLFFLLSGVLLLLALAAAFPSFGGLLGITALSTASGYGTAFAEAPGTAKVVFKVRCYDEGKTALQGLRGVRKVETGFHYIHETDTVYYDPKIITIGEMESALKKAGTYVGTIEEKERN